jgi:hypothetical protein
VRDARLATLLLAASSCGGVGPGRAGFSADPTPSVEPSATQATGPTSSTPPDTASDEGTSLDAQKRIASMRRDLAGCYNRALRKDPMLEGHVLLDVVVGPYGNVQQATATDLEGLSSEVVACLTTRIQSAIFTPPGPKGATIRIPLRFVRPTH